MTDNNNERRLLAMMRKTLTNIARETAPQQGRHSLLTESTVKDIRDCLQIISLRERELADAEGKPARFKPVTKDHKQRSDKVVSAPKLSSPKRD